MNAFYQINTQYGVISFRITKDGYIKTTLDKKRIHQDVVTRYVGDDSKEFAEICEGIYKAWIKERGFYRFRKHLTYFINEYHNGNTSEFCRANGINRGHLHRIIMGTRPVSEKLLEAIY